MNKIDIFKKELGYIKKSDYKKNAEILIELLPDYFFEIPASSTGKYHPTFALNQMGLVRHTKAAVRIACELLENQTIGSAFTQEEADLIIIAIIMHDGCKSGIVKSDYTVVDHPLLVGKLIKDNAEKLTFTDEETNLICSMIASHMGQWNTDYKGNEILPIPKNRYQKFVHMCDFLASKKFLDIKFENNEIVD